MNAFGLGVVSIREKLKTILECGSHQKISSGVTHDTENFGWLSPIHDGNDSHVNAYKKESIPREEMIKLVESLFPHLDAKEISKIPTVRPPDER